MAKKVFHNRPSVYFKASDLNQLTPEYVARLSKARVDELVEELRMDLLAAQDQLNRNSSNSSSPSSTDKPWNRGSKSSGSQETEPTEEEEDTALAQEVELVDADEVKPENQADVGEPNAKLEPRAEPETKKKPGKQRGAQGFGRTQKLPITSEKIHREERCAGCGNCLGQDLPFRATLAYHQLDLAEPEPGKIGLYVSNIKHVFGGVKCLCGFETTSHPSRLPKNTEWSVELSEWRLIGPKLLSLIVFLKLHMHATLSKTRNFFRTWLNISLSDGCINRALREAGRAASAMEPALRKALQNAGLLYVDESTWWEHKITRWIWVARGDDVVYYAIGSRTKEMAQELLKGFHGNLMSDGCQSYRHMPNRLRCWAHLERKAKGLKESWDKTAAEFGAYVLAGFEGLRTAVYRMREQSDEERQPEQKTCEEKRIELMLHCVRHVDNSHDGIGAFAFEILNDTKAIFRVLQEPDMPLTNNLAEQALRPLVIMRKISYGTKSDEGSRSVAWLASVVGTLKIRQHECWSFLGELFAGQRAARPPPDLPASVMV